MARILVVDDVDRNVKLLTDVLRWNGYEVAIAASGADALRAIETDPPDLMLLDVMMPGMDGYEVCRRVRADPAVGFLPIVMVTALDTSERVKGLDAGADDFVTKPVERAELLARVRSLLRIKSLYEEVQTQRVRLEEWNQTLESRVAEGVAQMERLSRLKRFFSPHVADMLLSAAAAADPLRTHRGEITVVFIDLRGYTAFTDSADPEEVMAVVRQYHQAMGLLINAYEGAVERFAGDSIMIFFNDPVPVPNATERAVRMALEMQREFAKLGGEWKARGYELDLGIGIAHGSATLGTIGFEGRFDYGVIGAVCSLAARLCAEAKGGQTLVSSRVYASIRDFAAGSAVGPLQLKGFHQPMEVYEVRTIRAGTVPSAAEQP